MNVNVKCFSRLSELYDCGYRESTSVGLPDEAGINAARKEIGIPAEEISIVFVNGIISKKDETLGDGDRLTFVPATGGM